MMYELVETEITIENRTYATFGMSCDGIVIEDISTDREEVKRLIKECNKEDLDMLHLHEVVENFLIG